MQIPPIDQHVGNEAARLQMTHFGRLAPYEERLRDSGRVQDHVYRTDGKVESGCLAIMINAQNPDFPAKPGLLITMERDSLSRPLFVGLHPIPMRLVDDDGSGGVLLTGGWDPTVEPNDDSAFDYLYVVAH